MATIKLGSSGSSGNSLNYVGERVGELEDGKKLESGINCNPETAVNEFAETREAWGKIGGIQAHTIIQSFVPGEVSAEEAHKVGCELAKQLSETLAKGHEIYIGTHTDKKHIHNHIVINSVSAETGRKYQSTKKVLYRIRSMNDALCQEHDLSIPKEGAKVRYTMAEQALIEKKKDSWKVDIRMAIDFVSKRVTDYAEFKQVLTAEFGIEIKDTGKHNVYTHPDGDSKHKIRGHKLGDDYTVAGVKNVINTRQIERGAGAEHQRTDYEPGAVGFAAGSNAGDIASRIKDFRRKELATGIESIAVPDGGKILSDFERAKRDHERHIRASQEPRQSERKFVVPKYEPPKPDRDVPTEPQRDGKRERKTISGPSL